MSGSAKDNRFAPHSTRRGHDHDQRRKSAGARYERAFQKMLEMKKLDLGKLESAFSAT